ncbi:CYTH domain-containing protein [Pseudomarimonas salicorniae]|uniref:CYTH domain-containing protein n=1 Tax=Pseudomarimonas salicorniae TaxID=2933270 RepID=A0ABT0GI56_9GAMM|nr:CYTH domain-containing protein [Lysobacter sp. CAU 1642]MCK7594228.1 CYTH domain-containing protein [Lysobacter sp. CAU 1642]
MGIEIERKFLVIGEAWRDAVERSEPMDQGYLGGERASVRVRIAGSGAFLNIKSKQGGASRLEFEYAVPVDEARDMLDALALPGRIAKRRHYVTHAGHLWEIDEFEGENAGLVVAEIELQSEDEAFERPAWLGEEVTHDLRYYNSALAQQPFSLWGKGADKES